MHPKILLVGMRCEFSYIVLEVLLTARFPVVGVIIPPPSLQSYALQRLEPDEYALPGWPPEVVGLAQTAQVPVWEVSRLHAPATFAQLAELAPDVLVCACFPRRLPAEWLTLPRRGGLNVHPSLLPAYRGPEPLFWQFRNGEVNTGVTLHHIDTGFDTGAIVAQMPVPLADGLSEFEAEWLMAQAGGQLLTQALAQATWPHTPQPTVGMNYAPFPTPEDLIISTTWPARRAFNFARGVEARGPLTVQRGTQKLLVKRAVSFEAQATVNENFAATSNLIQIAFQPGTVIFQLAEQP